MGWEIYTLGYSQNDLLHPMNVGDGEPFHVENTLNGKRVYCKKELADPNLTVEAAPAPAPAPSREELRAAITNAVDIAFDRMKARPLDSAIAPVFDTLEAHLFATLDKALGR